MSQEARSSPPKPKSQPPAEGQEEVVLPEPEEEEPWLTAVSPDDYPNEDTCKTFVFRNEGHTFGNALRHLISNYEDVKFCAYTLPHPAEKVMHLRIQTSPGIIPQDVLARGLNDLHDLAKITMEKFLEEMATVPPPEPEEEPDLPIPKYGVLDEDKSPAASRAQDRFTTEDETTPFPQNHSPSKQATFSSTIRTGTSPIAAAHTSPKAGPSAAGPAAATSPTAAAPQAGKTSDPIAQAREEEIARRDALREELRLKKQKKKKAAKERAAEEVESRSKKNELEKSEQEEKERLAKEAEEAARIEEEKRKEWEGLSESEKEEREEKERLAREDEEIARIQREYREREEAEFQETLGEEEEEEEAPPPESESEPESEPEVVDLDSD